MAVGQSEREQAISRVHGSHGNSRSSMENKSSKEPSRRRRVWVIPVVLVLGAVPLLVGWRMLMSDGVAASDTLVYYTAKRGTLPVTVTERGNLESQNTEEIVCQVESFGGDRSGVRGTQILYIIPNGTSVKKGDLLVELDPSPLRERLDSQFLSLQRALATKTQAIAKYDNQKIQNKTNLSKAELQLKLAEKDLDHYDQNPAQSQNDTGGLFQIALQDIELDIQTKLAQQMIAKDHRDAIELLHKLGFKSRGELEKAEVELLTKQSDLATTIAEKRQLKKYKYQKEILSRRQAVETARNNLTQVKRNNESELQQAEAARDSALRAYEKEKERHERYRKQLEQCKIHATQDGMVAYAMEREHGRTQTVVEKGAFVRERQKILTIPDLSRMQVKTSIHESVLDQVENGLDVSIQVDAFPEKRYAGTVKSVAVLPDQGNWFSSDTQVYETIITLDEDVQQLKPGMTAVVEIDIEKLRDVISVPIQAVVQRGEANWCFVKSDGEVNRREITLGKTNDKFVEVREGLDVDEVVVLNPSNLMEDDNEQAGEQSEKKEPSGKDAKEKKNSDDAGDASESKKRKPQRANAGKSKTGVPRNTSSPEDEKKKMRKP